MLDMKHYVNIKNKPIYFRDLKNMSYRYHQKSLHEYQVQAAYRSYLTYGNKSADEIILSLKLVSGTDIEIEDDYVVCISANERKHKDKRTVVEVRLVLLNAADASFENELKEIWQLKENDIGTCRFNSQQTVTELSNVLEYRIVVNKNIYNQILIDVNNSHFPTLVRLGCDYLDANNAFNEENAVIGVNHFSFITQYFSLLNIIKSKAINFYTYISNKVKLLGVSVLIILIVVWLIENLS